MKEGGPRFTAPNPESVPDFERVQDFAHRTFDRPHVFRTPSGIIAAGTERSPDHQDNEDRLVIDTEHESYVVIDGMGGLSDAKTAAAVAAIEFMGAFNTEEDDISIRVNEARLNAAKHLPKINGTSGVCYLAIHISNENLRYWQGGDCRLVVMDKDGARFRETKDQPVDDAIRSRKPGQMVTGEMEIDENSRFILASDGLWKSADTEVIVRAAANKAPEEAIKELGRLSKNAFDDCSILVGDINRRKISP